MLARTLARKTVHAALLLVAVTLVGFGANVLVERRTGADRKLQLPANSAEPDVPSAREYVGLAEVDAVRAIGADRLRARVVWRDGVDLVRHADIQGDRVNLYIRDGVVVDARRY